MGANGATGPEAVVAAEKNAALLTARAGARDPSAVPSICRISAALQYPAGEFRSHVEITSMSNSDFIKTIDDTLCLVEANVK